MISILCLCVYVFMCLCVYVFMCLCVYVFMCLCVWVFMCLGVYCFTQTITNAGGKFRAMKRIARLPNMVWYILLRMVA